MGGWMEHRRRREVELRRRCDAMSVQPLSWRRVGLGFVRGDEAIVGAAPWTWRTGWLNRRDGEMDDGSSSREVDEGRQAVAVDDVVGEEAPAGQR